MKCAIYITRGLHYNHELLVHFNEFIHDAHVDERHTTWFSPA